MNQVVIEVKNVTMQFAHWIKRPQSLKGALISMTKGQFHLFQSGDFYTVLDNVSFCVNAGEFVGVMGRNGAGKSTLFKLISGIYLPSKGVINTYQPIAPLIELGAGFHPDLTGLENIYLNAAILGFGKKATEAIIDLVIDFSELGNHIFQPIKNYSSGMLARLGFSVAINLETPILLVDEILAVGDIGFQQKCTAKIQQLHDQGKTIILITHSPDAIENYCTRCIIIDKTKKVFDGNPKQGAEFYRKLF